MASLTAWELTSHKVNTYAYYTHAFDDMIEHILSHGDSLRLKSATVGSSDDYKSDSSIRKTKVAWIDGNPDSAPLFYRLTDIILTANKEWFEFDLTSIEQIQYTLYEEGDFYNQHVDHMHEAVGSLTRKLSFVLQLTDPSEYDGGNTELITGPEILTIPKEKGTITFFPSYVLHRVTPITRGTRKALVGWVREPKWK